MSLSWLGMPVTCLVVFGLALHPAPARAQAPVRSTPPVRLGSFAFDPVLDISPSDSAELVQAARQQLLARGLISTAPTAETPALDVRVFVPRSVSDGQPQPILLLSVEVGRNLMEAGRRESLVWSLVLPSKEFATFTALRRGVSQALQLALVAYSDQPGRS